MPIRQLAEVPFSVGNLFKMTDTSVHANNPPETAEYSSPGVSQEKHSDGDSEERSAQLKHINQEPSTPAQHTVPPPPDGGYGKRNEPSQSLR